MPRLFKKSKSSSKQKKERSKFWLFTISEFVIVVFGILFALQIDNWNEARKENKLEQKYLIDIKKDISSDLSVINKNINYLKGFQQSVEITIQFLSGNIEYADSLDFHFSNAIIGVYFQHNISTFESLKEAGLNIISNSTLRNEITQLYSGSYNTILHLQNIVKDYMIGIIIPEYVRHFQIIEPLKIARPVELALTNNSTELRSSLKQMTLYLQIETVQYEETRNSINQIVAMIEKELD